MDFSFHSEQLILFTTVVREGSFSQAGRVLGLNVSTVTRQLNRLEQMLGVKLFIRSSRQLQLTRAGRLLLQRAETMLADMTETVSEIRALEQDCGGQLRISCLPTFARTILLPLMREPEFRARNIRLQLKLTERISDPVTERLDLAVRTGPLVDSSLFAESVGVQRWYVCAGGRFMARPLKELRGQPLIDKFSHAFSPCWQGVEAENTVVQRCDDFDVQRQMAEAGVGLVCLPGWCIAESVAAGRLKVMMPDPHHRAEPVSILRPFRERSPAAVYLTEQIRLALTRADDILPSAEAD